jgi:phosphomannomutase
MLDRYEEHHLGTCTESNDSTSLDPTGFKYIGNTALDLVKTGLHVPFGYEEAIGFMFGDEIRDKDGVAATVRSLGVMKFAFGSDIKPSR